MSSTASKLIRMFVILSVLSGCACAGFTMNIQVKRPSFKDNLTSDILLDATNNGDEPAHDSAIRIAYPAGVAGGPILIGSLEPGVKNERVQGLSIDPSFLPGDYPLILVLNFKDKNDYPLSMIFESGFYVARHSSSQIRGNLTVSPLGYDGIGAAKYVIDNLDDRPHNVSLHVLAPGTVEVEGGQETVMVGAKSQASVDYRLRNVVALPESGLTVIAVAEYDDGGTHYYDLSKSRTKVAGARMNEVLLALALASAVAAVSVYSYHWLRER